MGEDGSDADEEWTPPTPDEIARGRAILAEELADLAREYEQSGNPLFVWCAIGACQHQARHEAVITTAAAEALGPAFFAALPSHLPDWVMRYLCDAAHALHNLMLGRDWRALPDTPDEGWSERDHEAWRAWEAGTLAPDEAARLVTRTLGFTRPGLNAFADLKARARAQSIAEDIEHLRSAEGMSAEKAAERVADTEGYQDPRSVKRIVSKARRGVAKPTG